MTPFMKDVLQKVQDRRKRVSDECQKIVNNEKKPISIFGKKSAYFSNSGYYENSIDNISSKDNTLVI